MASSRDTSNGPDWTDVGLLLRELQILHKSSVKLVMQPDGPQHSSSMDVEAFAVREGHLGTEVGYSVSVKYRVTPARPGQMPAMMLRLLYELDRMCLVTFWRQGELIL